MTRALLHERPDLPFRLGRHIDHDPRNRDHPFRTAGAKLVSRRHHRYESITDQGDLGSCTGHAGNSALSTGVVYGALSVKNRGRLGRSLAEELYSDATLIDPFPGAWPPQDTGSNGQSVAKVMKRRRLISGYQWTFSMEDALLALTQTPAMLGIPWYDSMFIPEDTYEVRVESDAIMVGGHEVCLDEIDVERGRVWFSNSWGSDWGAGGRAWLAWETLERLLDEWGDVCIPVPVGASLFERVKRFFSCF